MPRSSNPTVYDQNMYVFKQAPRESVRTRRPAPPGSTHAATHATSGRHSEISHQNVSSVANSSGQVMSPGGTSTYPPWGEPPVAISPTTYGNMTTYPPSMPDMPLAPSASYQGSAATSGAPRWCLVRVVNGQNQSPTYLSATRLEIPSSHCVCGTPFRFVHLPTIAAAPNWQPEVGVLWAFYVNGGHGWMEGSSNPAYVSQVSCPVCRASICLYGPF